MKIIIFLYLTLLSFSSFSQYPNEAELESIISRIAIPLETGDKDLLLQHITFPFSVGSKKYTSKAQLLAAFSKVFIEDYKSCLKAPKSYQLALPDNHTWYMAVCFSAPEGYDATVFTFKKVNEQWMLDSIDLQKDEE